MTIASAIHALARAHPRRLALVDDNGEVTLAEVDARARAVAGAVIARGLERVPLAAEGSVELAIALLGVLYAGRAVAPVYAGTPGAAGVDVRSLVGDPIDAPIEGEDALVLTTSGTTGAPRSVIVGHRSLAAHTTALARTLALTPADRVLCVLPLAHSYGFRMALLVPLLSGATVVIAKGFSARGSLATIERRGITWVPVVPTMLAAWCAVAGERVGLRACMSAGAPLSAALRAAAEARLGCTLREAYGMSEASIATIDGLAVPGVEIRLDPNNHEILVRGQNLMSGYEDASGRTLPLDDGWFRSGDIGRIDDGRLVIVDRIKDIVLVGGSTIHPAEVEAAIAAHPAVKAVAVVGEPDPFLGERLVAHVVGDADPAELEAFVCERLVAYKVPRVWRRVAELPLGASGKVLRRALRGLPQGPDHA